jgi:MerR family transcriptional regulator, aldehyde-responsive regulator
MSALELRRSYLDLKVQYWSARELGDLDKASAVPRSPGHLIHRINPKDTP